MAKFEIISPFLAMRPDKKITKIEKNNVKKFIKSRTKQTYGTSGSIEQLLSKICLAKTYDDIPETISFSYNDLINRNLDFKQVIELVSLTAKLSASRFNQQPKEIIFSGNGILQEGIAKITQQDYVRLTQAGFLGCTLSPINVGIETAIDAADCWRKDHTYWSPIIVPDQKIIVAESKPIEIILTYRQQQIADMISKKGMTNYQIAKKLGLSESTVKMHIGLILKKYCVQHRTQLIIAMQK